MIAVVLMMAALHFLFEYQSWSKRPFTLQPRSFESVYGIFTAQFLHSDWNHLLNNSMPILVLGTALRYFFPKQWGRVVLISIVVTALWVWAFARPAYHLGASGWLYALAGFLFTSGVLRKSPNMYALSLLVVFLYGGMIWGIFPIDYKISWESHLLGLVVGVWLAFYYRHQGPQRAAYSWEIEERIQAADFEVVFEEVLPASDFSSPIVRYWIRPRE